MIDVHFVLLGAALNLFGSGRYVYDTLRGRTQPNRVTWSLWALAPLVAFGAEVNQGVGLRSLMTFMVGFGPLAILIASFLNAQSQWKLTRFDLVCAALSLLGLLLWALTRHGNVAIVFGMLADALAAVPTLRKAYREPETESYLAFLSSAASASITLLTVKQWVFAAYGFPAYILAVCLSMVVLVKLRPQKRLRRNAQSD